jgi:ABC-2 type transport system permease protein
VSATADTASLRARHRGLPILVEAQKVTAFMRRDFLMAWSYRMAFFSDIAGMLVQAVTFYFVGRMVNPSVLPTFGGQRVTYMEFAAIGIAFGAFMSVGLGQVAAAVRQEQLMGTLESLLMTPTSPGTIQVGSVAYQLILVPLRTGLFLLLIAVAFGLNFSGNGIVPAALVFALFTPFVWGLGLLTAAGVLTFKRGTAGVGLGVTLLVLGSGAYFPLALLPHWVATVAGYNPLALAIGGVRAALLGGVGWGALTSKVLLLLPMAAVSLAVGVGAFRLAVRRERSRGSIGLY